MYNLFLIVQFFGAYFLGTSYKLTLAKRLMVNGEIKGNLYRTYRINEQ